MNRQDRAPVRARREGFVSESEIEDLETAGKEAYSGMTKQPDTIEAVAESATKQEKEEAEPKRAVPPTVTWPFTYKLRFRPLKISHNESVEELTFREPNAGDILDYGNPINIEVTQAGRQLLFGVQIDDNKMMLLLGNLCTDKRIQSQHLNRLDVRDYANIANRLRRFFRPDWDMVNY